MPLSPQTAHRKDLTAPPVVLQHRHLATIAAVIRGYGREVSTVEAHDVAEYFARELLATNPKFDRERFLSACSEEA